jgi:hypothetical protein
MQSNKKAQGKVMGNFHYTPTSTTRNYYDEEIIDRDGPFIIYQLETQYESIFKTLLTVSNWYQYCRLYQENFKRFISHLKYDN